MDNTEAEHFRRIQVNAEIERATGIIAGYRKGIDFYRAVIDEYHEALGRIAERLGEPENKMKEN